MFPDVEDYALSNCMTTAHGQLDSQRSLFQTKYAEYWRSAISEFRYDARALWSRVNSLLSPPADSTTPASTHTMHDLVTFFGRKVEDIRTATSTATSPSIQVRPSCSEVTKILASMPSKSCFLDPVPTWIVKKIHDVLASVICNLCNATLRFADSPACQKQAIVLPRPKKSTLDPDHLTSYRQISNVSFTSSKVVERIIASRFVRHAEDMTYSRLDSLRTAEATQLRQRCSACTMISYELSTASLSPLLSYVI